MTTGNESSRTQNKNRTEHYITRVKQDNSNCEGKGKYLFKTSESQF
jgi:hypothetical protein